MNCAASERHAFAALRFVFATCRVYDGIAIALRTATISTTTISSTRVKPRPRAHPGMNHVCVSNHVNADIS